MEQYPKELLNYLTGTIGVTQAELQNMTHNEIFDTILNFEGFGQYAGFFVRDMIKNIYGIDLARAAENRTRVWII